MYQIYGDATYLAKATNIYNWEKNTLFFANGLIADGYVTNGVTGGATTYNQGTFIGAANFLSFTNDAALAARFTMLNMTRHGVLVEYAVNNNNSGFNAIGLRWVSRYVRDRQLQNIYQPWFQTNAEAAWNRRRTSDNLSWCRWLTQTPAATNLFS